MSVCGVLLTLSAGVIVCLGAKGRTGDLKLCRELEHDGL